MSMIECAHCRRAADGRSMQSCEGCGSMVCEDCSQSADDCPGEDSDFEE